MTNTKFTPGPWDNKGTHKWSTDFGIFNSSGRGIASTGGYSDGQEGTFEENKANAHLISAAPELYKGADPFDEWFRFHAADAPEWNEADTVKVYLSIGELRAIKAARAKARGES